MVTETADSILQECSLAIMQKLAQLLTRRLEPTKERQDISKMPKQGELELVKRCDEVLYYVWDPIGCDGAPAARDEYSSYVRRTVELLLAEKSEKEIANYLLELQTQHMGLRPDPERAENAAEVLVGWYNWIYHN